LTLSPVSLFATIGIGADLWLLGRRLQAGTAGRARTDGHRGWGYPDSRCRAGYLITHVSDVAFAGQVFTLWNGNGGCPCSGASSLALSLRQDPAANAEPVVASLDAAAPANAVAIAVVASGTRSWGTTSVARSDTGLAWGTGSLLGRCWRRACGKPHHSQAHIAPAMGVSRKCVKTGIDCYAAEGDAGLVTRSSRPHLMPTRTSAEVEQKVLSARAEHRDGPDVLGPRVGVAARTVSRILRRQAMPYLRECDPMTGQVIANRAGLTSTTGTAPSGDSSKSGT